MNYIWQTQMWLLQGGSVFLLKTMTYQTAHVVYLHLVKKTQFSDLDIFLVKSYERYEIYTSVLRELLNQTSTIKSII